MSPTCRAAGRLPSSPIAQPSRIKSIASLIMLIAIGWLAHWRHGQVSRCLTGAGRLNPRLPPDETAGLMRSRRRGAAPGIALR